MDLPLPSSMEIASGPVETFTRNWPQLKDCEPAIARVRGIGGAEDWATIAGSAAMGSACPSAAKSSRLTRRVRLLVGVSTSSIGFPPMASESAASADRTVRHSAAAPPKRESVSLRESSFMLAVSPRFAISSKLDLRPYLQVARHQRGGEIG